jgi:hypothetical protein
MAADRCRDARARRAARAIRVHAGLHVRNPQHTAAASADARNPTGHLALHEVRCATSATYVPKIRSNCSVGPLVSSDIRYWDVTATHRTLNHHAAVPDVDTAKALWWA